MSWSCGKQHCPTHSSPEHQCHGWALAALGASVGDGGKNVAADVRIVQGALNRLTDPDRKALRYATDGKCAPQVIAAIRQFQHLTSGSGNPDGRVDPGGKTWRALAQALKAKRIRVSLKEQVLEAIQDGRVVYRFPCMTGGEDSPTDVGTFKVIRRYTKYRSKTYDAQMDYAMFFTQDGKAIHQYHGPLGLTVVRAMKRSLSDWFGSHGCVRLSEGHARRLFEWTPDATPVQIY